MRTVIICTIISVLAIALIPNKAYAAEEKSTAQYVLVIEDDAQKTIRLKTKDGVIEQKMDEYLASVLLSEMPYEFALEARKAQCVAARTFTYKKMLTNKHADCDLCADYACCQAWRTKEAIREEYGKDFDKVWSESLQIVKDTQDEVIVYDGELIDATYFSCAAGSTEAAAAVWGTDVPYLQPVMSYGEEKAARYASTAVFSAEEFKRAVTGLSEKIKLGKDPTKWIGKIAYTKGGGVATMKIGNTELKGTQVRSAFGLNSTKFEVSYKNGEFTFCVHGFGHRVGMSQYGADYMARQGYDYKVILPYYYAGVQIKKLSQLLL